jgi:threonine 3-dehydrogenase
VQTMRAVIKPQQGVGFELANVPIPKIGPRDVLIRVKAASICGSDLPIYAWDDPWVRATIQPGQIVGHEFCGIVSAVGSEVQRISIGELVTAEGHISCGVCVHCRSGEAHICPSLGLIGFDRPGAFAEFIAVPAVNVVPIGELPPVVGAILDPFGNAVHAATKVPLTNASVLVTGCGPVGLMTIALAKVAGAYQIFATDISEYRLSLASAMGASVPLDARKPDVDDYVLHRTTATSGVDVFLEMSGSTAALQQGFRLLRNGGQAVLMGLPKEPSLFDFTNSVIVKGITIHGLTGRLMYRTWIEAFRYLGDGTAPGSVDVMPMITHRLLIDEYDQGVQLMRSGQCGKVILFFDQASLDESYSSAIARQSGPEHSATLPAGI